MSRITRIWHGKTLKKHADQYLNYIKDTGLKDYLVTPGILSAKVLRKIEGDICHIQIRNLHSSDLIRN